jgi:hypothetical protein
MESTFQQRSTWKGSNRAAGQYIDPGCNSESGINCRNGMPIAFEDVSRMLLPTTRIVGTSNLTFISFPGLSIQREISFKSVQET